MKYRTDDAAVRVEFRFHDLPGEARWQQWVRGYKFGAVAVPASGAGGWGVASMLGAPPLTLVLSAVLSAAAGLAVLVAALTWAGRYETPETPMRYRMWQIRQEAAAPRRPNPKPADVPPATRAQFGPTRWGPDAQLTRYRSHCAIPTCPEARRPN